MMVKEFEIIKLEHHHNRGLFIIARHIGSRHDFIVEEGALLGEIPVFHYLEIRPEPDIFTFRPLNIEDSFIAVLRVGQRIKLGLEDRIT